MRQLCGGMAMEFFVENEATEFIYLTNKSSEDANDETIIACKQFREGEKVVAVFAVGDEWQYVTPYASNESGSTKGNGERLHRTPSTSWTPNRPTSRL